MTRRLQRIPVPALGPQMGSLGLAPIESTLTAWIQGSMVAVVFLTPVLFCRWTHDAFVFPKTLFFQTCALLVFALVGTRWLHTANSWRRLLPSTKDWLAWGMLLYGGSALVSTLCSPAPLVSLYGDHQSYLGLIPILCGLLLFFGIRGQANEEAFVRRGLYAIWASGLLAVGYALLQWLKFDPYTWEAVSKIGSYQRPFGTLGHANLFGAYCAMQLPLVAYLGWQAQQQKKTTWLLILALSALVFSFGVMISLSRAALLAMGCGVGVVLLTLFPRKQAIRLFVFGVICFTLAVLVVPQLQQRIMYFFSSAGRFYFWTAAWNLFLDSPLFGCGLDTFAHHFGQYRAAELEKVEWDTTPCQAHNLILQVLATQGLFGLLALLVIGAGLFQSIFCCDGTCRIRQRLLGGCVLVFVIQTMFGFAETGCGTSILFLFGVLSIPKTLPEPSTFRSTPARFFGSVAVSSFVLICGYHLIYQPLRASMLCLEALQATSTAPEVMTDHFAEALSHAPQYPIFWSLWGVNCLQAADDAKALAQKIGYWKLAQKAFEEAIQRDPFDAYAHANLARTLQRQPHLDVNLVLHRYSQALHWEPRNPRLLLDAGQAALELNQLDYVQQISDRLERDFPYYAAAITLKADLAWAKGDHQRAARISWEALHADWYGEWENFRHWYIRSAELHLRSGLIDQAYGMGQELRSRLDPFAGYLILALCQEQRGQIAEAHQSFQEALRLRPNHLPARQGWERTRR